MTLSVISQTWAIEESKKILKNLSNDFLEDEWFAIAVNWDLNVFDDENGNRFASLYPVENGNTKTDVSGISIQ